LYKILFNLKNFKIMGKKLLLVFSVVISTFLSGLSQNITSYVQKQLDNYFTSKGIKFDHHTIYEFNVNQQQKLVYAITELNMMEAQRKDQAFISIFVFEKNQNKWTETLKKIDYYKDGSFGQFALGEGEIELISLKNGEFVFYYEQIRDSLDGSAKAWLYIFGYKKGQLYRSKILIGETNESTQAVAQNPKLYYSWEAEDFHFEGNTLQNLYLVLNIKEIKGASAQEIKKVKKIKVNFKP